MASSSKSPQRSLTVCVAGVTGAVGRLLTRAILNQGDFLLTSAVARSAGGQTVGEVLNVDCNVRIRPSLAEALSHDTFDVLVDYTSASSAFDNVRMALAGGIHVVVGSSGVTAEQFESLDRLARARQVGAIHGNFAITATLAQVFAAAAARYLKSWEIIEYAYEGKIDAVSGTARELASRLAETSPPEQHIAPDEFVGDCRSRGATVAGTQVHALRLPGMVAGFEIIFGRSHERLTIKHEAISRAEPYVNGTLVAIRHVTHLVGMHRGLESVLDLSFSN
jgi:4-hydroxy-tetrahydrodipicolinate reductase